MNLAEASRNFTEMMLALAVLDLPFEAGEHEPSSTGREMTLTAGSPLIVFHEEIKPAKPQAGERRRSWSARTSSATATASARRTTSRSTSS